MKNPFLIRERIYFRSLEREEWDALKQQRR